MAASNYNQHDYVNDDDLLEYERDFNDADDCYEDFDVENRDDLLTVATNQQRKRKSILISVGGASSAVSASKRRSSRSLQTTPRIATTSKYSSKSSVSRKSVGNDGLSTRIDRLCEFVHVLMHCLLFKINYYNKKTHFDRNNFF